jgi:hypothetical protein
MENEVDEQGDCRKHYQSEVEWQDLLQDQVDLHSGWTRSEHLPIRSRAGSDGTVSAEA